jgi:hypothetical protein
MPRYTAPDTENPGSVTPKLKIVSYGRPDFRAKLVTHAHPSGVYL